MFIALKSGSVWVLGWTPQIIWTIFYWNTCNLFKWTEAAVLQTWIPYDMWGNINELYKFSKVSDSNALRAFIIMPVHFAIFRETHLICSIQFNLLSIVIPKNSALSPSWILDPFMLMVGQSSFLPLGLNIIKLTFSILRDSLLAFNHSISFINSLMTSVASSCKFF